MILLHNVRASYKTNTAPGCAYTDTLRPDRELSKTVLPVSSCTVKKKLLFSRENFCSKFSSIGVAVAGLLCEETAV